MTTNKINILVVDDELLIRNIINHHLSGIGYNVIEAEDGADAWSILQTKEFQFDAIILDRNMPNMNGLELLNKVKADTTLQTIPVIMQTASNEKHQVLEGLQSGCYYYLTKPFEKDLLLSIVKAATDDHIAHRTLQDELKNQNQSLILLDSGRFSFRSLNEAKILTTLLAAACPEPDKVAMGLSEMLINAIEHGNLGISYKEKSQLIEDEKWKEEIERRLTLDEYSKLKASAVFERKENEISILISDQGKGFDWQQYLEMSPERSQDSHGRGIAMANMLSFNSIEYQGTGSEVLVKINTTT